MQSVCDTELLMQLKTGNPAAFDALYIKYYKLLCLSAYFFLRDEQQAKDIVQSLFINIWEKKLYLHFHEDIKGYLYLAVKNRCLNEVAKEKVKEEHHKAFAVLQEEKITEPAYDARYEYYNTFRNTLEDMSGQKRIAIHMVYTKGKSYQDAANEMGISINSFKTHLKSGLKILREAIKINKNH